MVAVDSFATAEQMAERSKGAIPADRPFLDVELKAATRLIRDHCGWHIAEVVTETVTLDGRRGQRELYLPTAHLLSVDSITLDGTALVLNTDGLQWSTDGIVSRDYWSWKARSIVVEITHGFAVIPETLVDLTLQLAARALSSPTGAVREQTLTSSVTWSQPGFNVAGGLALLPHEIDSLAAYKVGYTP